MNHEDEPGVDVEYSSQTVEAQGAAAISTPVSISAVLSSLSRERTNSLDGLRPASSIDDSVSNSLTPRYSSPFATRFEQGQRNERLDDVDQGAVVGISFESIEQLQGLIIETCSKHNGDIELLDKLIECGRENGLPSLDLINFTKLHSSLTPLHHAASRNNSSIAHWLILHGAILDAVDEQGEVSPSSDSN